MLQFETLPGSWSALLWTFRRCFTAPTFAMFAALVSGMVAAPARRTVSGMLIAAGVSRLWHHSRAYWFFGRARWCVDQVGLVLARLVVSRLLTPDAPVELAVDDTLFRRSGRKVHATGWHRDGSAKVAGKNRICWGNCWIIVGIVVALPFLGRRVCLPVAFALWRKDGTSKQVAACQLITSIAAALPDRRIHVAADAWYAGADGASGAARGATRQRGLPEGITLTSRLRVNAVLEDIAAPQPRRGGRPRRRGQRIGTPKDLAARPDLIWTATQVCRYGRVDTVHLAEQVCLWYGAYRSRAVRVILLRETGTARGYDLALISTDLVSPAEAVVTRYADRWSIEVAIEDAKQLTGVGQTRTRTRTAVERTVPFGLITQSLVTVWYALHGYHPDDVTHRRDEAPWYPGKTHPAYLDMIVKLRRTLIAARFRAGKRRQPTPEETLAVHAAWADAAA
jgi:hypothetical protein